jgi:hypothetical protein
MSATAEIYRKGVAQSFYGTDFDWATSSFQTLIEEN